MMRAGDKLASYEILAEALSEIAFLPWTLDIVGDGEARSRVEALFGRVGDRVRFYGQVDDRERLGALYASADLFLWPAVNEAYGMALLEAQAHGCPVVAGSFGGVPSVVRHGETGILTRPGDPADFARAVSELLMDDELRRQLGTRARRFVRSDRGLEAAAERIRVALSALLADYPSP